LLLLSLKRSLEHYFFLSPMPSAREMAEIAEIYYLTQKAQKFAESFLFERLGAYCVIPWHYALSLNL